MRLLAALIRLLLWPALAAFWLLGQLLRLLCYSVGFLPVRLAGVGLIIYAAATEPMPAGAFYGMVIGWPVLSYLAWKLAPKLRLGRMPRVWTSAPARPARPKTVDITPPAPPSLPQPASRGPRLPAPSFVHPAVRMPLGTPVSETEMIRHLDPALQTILLGAAQPSP